MRWRRGVTRAIPCSASQSFRRNSWNSLKTLAAVLLPVAGSSRVPRRSQLKRVLGTTSAVIGSFRSTGVSSHPRFCLQVLRGR